jgi:hypothetical protein
MSARSLTHSLGVYNGIHTPPREVPFMTDCLFIFMPGNTIGFSTRYGLGASSPLTTTPQYHLFVCFYFWVPNLSYHSNSNDVFNNYPAARSLCARPKPERGLVGVHVKQRRRAALALVQHVREAAANIPHQGSQCPLINTHKQILFK